MSGQNTNSHTSNQETPTGLLFPQLKRTGDRPIRYRGNKNNKTSLISCVDFFQHLETLFTNNLKNSMNKIRKLLNKIKKKVLKEIAYNILERNEDYTFHENREQWYRYILDIIDSKHFKPVQEKTEKNIPKIYMYC